MGDPQAVARRYDAGAASLLVERLIGDLLTPVAAFLKLSAKRQGRCFLLESVEGNAARGRYSMIGVDPDILFKVEDGQASVNRCAGTAPDAFEPCPVAPLAALRALLA